MNYDLGRTGQLFADIADQGRAALVGFLHVGYPSVEGSLVAFRALTGADDPDGAPGVDLVEIGMPYSDPMMDGQTIQRGCAEADAVFHASASAPGLGRWNAGCAPATPSGPSRRSPRPAPRPWS